MNSNRTFSETTSAADKSIGFDFQFYYFLLRLLNLEEGQRVGLEVHDDVHEEIGCDILVLMQLKFTIQRKADGNPINLTTLDEDLWKSISNWCHIICDKAAGRGNLEEQIKFASKTSFLLVSNKLENEGNKFIELLLSFQRQEIEFEELNSELLKINSKSPDVSNYIENLRNLNPEVSQEFLKNLKFDLGIEDIVDQCRKAIRRKMIADDKVDDVLRDLSSQIRLDIFQTVQLRKKIVIDFESFHKQYRRHFDLARNSPLEMRRFDGNLPDGIEKQIFIQQLIEIGDVSSEDTDEMVNLTKKKLSMQNSLDRWYNAGLITNIEKDNLDQEAFDRWENRFRSTYRNCDGKDLSEKACKLLDSIRTEKLAIASTELDTAHSNGQFYRISDNNPRIGWHKEWRSKFGGK